MQKLLAKDRRKTCTFIFGWSANRMLYENGNGISCKPIHVKVARKTTTKIKSGLYNANYSETRASDA